PRPCAPVRGNGPRSDVGNPCTRRTPFPRTVGPGMGRIALGHLAPRDGPVAKLKRVQGTEGTMRGRMDLGAALREKADADLAKALAGIEGLDATLRRHLDDARAAYPDVRVDDERFVAHVARCLPAEETDERIASLHAADLYLALACGMGDSRAIAELEKSFIA